MTFRGAKEHIVRVSDSRFFIYLTNKCYALFIALIIVSFFIFGQAKAEISVSDYHIKLIVEELLIPTKKSMVSFPFATQGDPHHYEPNVKAIKQFLNSKFFIINQSGDGWKLSLEEKLNSLHQSSHILVLSLKKNAPDLLKNENPHALSHFWLIPEVGCKYFQEIKTFLQNHKLPTKAIDCPYQLNNQILTLKSNHPWHKIIITHDASEYFFKKFEDQNIIILRSSHHGDRVKAEELKNVYQATQEDQKKPILWLFESQLEIPTRLERRVRSFDHIININTLGDNIKNTQEVLQDLQKQVLEHAKQGLQKGRER